MAKALILVPVLLGLVACTAQKEIQEMPVGISRKMDGLQRSPCDSKCVEVKLPKSEGHY